LRNVEGVAHRRNCLRPPARPPADIPQSKNQFFPSENLVNKWKILKKKAYKKIIDENNSTGNCRSQWKFLEEFNNMYGHTASTSPALIFDSGKTGGNKVKTG
jgi:hypothetical protein